MRSLRRMPDKSTTQRVRKDKAAGKSGSTQAGEFVRQEMHHIRSGKHGARNTKQAIAIGLSEARRAGVKVPASGGKATRRKAKQESARAGKPVSAKRSRASERRLKKEPRKAATHRALSRHSHAVAKKAARTRKSRAR
jgi:hypothetical protein